MKKIVYILSIVTLSVMLVSCNEKDEPNSSIVKVQNESHENYYEEDSIYKEYNTEFNLKEVLETNKDLLSGDVDFTTLKMLDREEAQSLYRTNEYDITVFQSTEGSFVEISALKFPNTDKLIDVLSLISQRTNEIRMMHQELADENQITLEVNNGVLTLVASKENSLKISDIISSSLKEE